MNQTIQQTNKIIGETFFGKLPKDLVLLESDFVRLDRSIIWKCSELFWKHYTLWEEVYDEDFESSLPSGISESHREEFIKRSAEKFVALLKYLQRKKQLPEKIYVYEQGPGLGTFAKGFLDHIKITNEGYYKNIIYVLTDTSGEVLRICEDVLKTHKTHTKYFNQEEFEHMTKFNNTFLFARHSNVWDGWPCRNIQVRESGLGEVYVRAISDKKFEKFILEIKKGGLEDAILHNKNEWKEFFRSIKMQTRTISFSNIDLEDTSYFRYLHKNTHGYKGTNTLLSDLIIQNLSFLNRIINWDKGGYAEIVDIISTKPRKIYPKKFDGSIAYIVDGNIISHWANEQNKDIQFTPLRKLNTMVTITKKNPEDKLIEMISQASYEIFPTDKVIQDIGRIEKSAHLAVTATSKKGLNYTIDAAVALREKGYNAYPHIIARQIVDGESLKDIKTKLTNSYIKEIFVAAGDIDHAKGEFHSAMDVLHGFKSIGISFGKVAITGYPEGHPKIPSGKLLDALEEKQKFIRTNKLQGRIISQLCFNSDTIVKWAVELKEKGVELPIVVGIAGPCTILQLVQFAIKCGVGESVKFITSKKTLGKNITANIVLQYQPETIIREIIKHPLFTESNIVGFHFYTFNNMKGLVSWKRMLIKELEVIKQ